VGQKIPNLFLSELRQIFMKCDNFWRTGGQDDEIMLDILIFHLA